MKKLLIIPCIAAVFLLACVCTSTASVDIIGGADRTTSIIISDKGESSMTNITMDEAKEIFQTPGDYIILDVRRADEFSAGHIPGAINVANESINSQPPDELPDLEQLIFVYCRSGNRSKQAAAKLLAMGYTHVVEFGGIIDWTGEIEH